MTLAIVQARMGSHRLPGKVLMKVRGKSLLAHLLGRLEKSELVDNIVVGTPDEIIRDDVESNGYDCVVSDRDEDDVLGRYVDIAEEYGADTVVRITGDCPLIDGGIVDQTISVLGDHDFATNVSPRTYPQGLDVEVMTIETLHRLDAMLGEGDPEREHVCVHVYLDDDFSISSLVDEEDHSNVRWCVDDEEDFIRVSNILSRWGDLPYREILKCMTS